MEIKKKERESILLLLFLRFEGLNMKPALEKSLKDHFGFWNTKRNFRFELCAQREV